MTPVCEVVRKVMLDQEIRATYDIPVNDKINLSGIVPDRYYMKNWTDCVAVVESDLFPIPGIIRFDKWVKNEKGELELVEAGREMAENLFKSMYVKISNN